MNNYMDEILNKKYGFLRLFIYTLRISFLSCPIHFIIFLVVDIINCMLAFGMTYYTTNFFEVIEKSSRYSEQVFYALLMLCSVVVLQHLTNGIGHSIIPALKMKLDKNAMVCFERKMQEIPPLWFENTDFLNFIEKAYKGTEYSFALLIPMLRFLFKYGPYCIILGVYLYKFDPMLALCVVLIFIPTFLSIIIKPEIIFKLEDSITPVRRMDAYIKKCVGDSEYFKETRTLGIFSYFKKKYLQNITILNSYIWNANIKIRLVELFTTIISVAGYGGLMILLVVSLLKGNISIAMYASVLSSITMMYAMCDDAASHFLMPFDGMAIVNNFVVLLKFSFPCKKGCEIAFDSEILVENVTFSYPKSGALAVDHVSCKIKSGETIAVVGTNGSGKTTFAKLLLGLYIPDSGSIKVGGVDIADVLTLDVHKGMSAVFQNFQKYKMSVADNIVISDTSLEDKDHMYLNKSTTHLDVDICDENYVEGYDTILSRDFGGIELSGGQWQKLAIARGIYRDRKIIVLDEPTSAIDPLEETAMYQKFAEISKGKTSIIITHRIGITKIADRIIVMDKGKIVQCGTYEELFAKEGKFREMLLAQHKWYIREEE